jgi:hypothetical protein
MEEQFIDILDLLKLILFLGSVVYLVGISLQLYISIRQDRMFKFKQIFLIVSTTTLSIVATYLIWSIWTFKLDFMFGPILIPALISEIIIVPIFLRFFKYKLKIKNK